MRIEGRSVSDRVRALGMGPRPISPLSLRGVLVFIEASWQRATPNAGEKTIGGETMPSIVIAQGGGPTAVINQTLCGAIGTARRLDPGLRILGARYGVRGLTGSDIVDLAGLSESDLVKLGNTPNSALGSTRDKPDPKACEAIFAALDALEARAFIYIGGNDTAGTLELLRARSSGSAGSCMRPRQSTTT